MLDTIHFRNPNVFKHPFTRPFEVVVQVHLFVGFEELGFLEVKVLPSCDILNEGELR